MYNEERVVAIIQDCAQALHRGKILGAELDVRPETILLGSDSPLDSLGFVALISEVESRINDETGGDLSISLMEVEGLDESNPHMTAGKLAAYISRELAG
jgi:hypothetical protein